MRLLLALLLLPSLSHAATPEIWEKGCELFEEDDFLVSRLEVNGANWRRIRIAYEEEGCLNAWIVFEEEAAIVKQQGEELDLRTRRVGYRPLTAEVAEALNLGAFCGLRDWKAGLYRDVTGRECGDFDVPAAGAVTYTRRKQGEGLFLGEASAGHEGASPETRHVSLERTPYLQK